MSWFFAQTLIAFYLISTSSKLIPSVGATTFSRMKLARTADKSLLLSVILFSDILLRAALMRVIHTDEYCSDMCHSGKYHSDSCHSTGFCSDEGHSDVPL